MDNLELVGSIRQSIKALDFEIVDLRRNRRGLAPFEYDHIRTVLSERLQAKHKLNEWLQINGFTL